MGDGLKYLVERASKEHKSFTKRMHLYFGVEDPSFVEEIIFQPLLVDGGYGSKPVFFVNYDGYSDITPLMQLNFDLTIYHETAHHLHRSYHGDVFENPWTIEPIIDYSVLFHLHFSDKKEHLELFREQEDVCFELYERCNCPHNLKALLIASEEEAREHLIRMLGKGHSYFMEEEFWKDDEED